MSVPKTETPTDAQAAIDRVLALHRPYGIYDECGHKHTELQLIHGDCLDIIEVGLTCEDGLMYRICVSCCTDGGGQTEECVSNHEHVKGEPICPTMAAIAGASE